MGSCPGPRATIGRPGPRIRSQYLGLVKRIPRSAALVLTGLLAAASASCGAEPSATPLLHAAPFVAAMGSGSSDWCISLFGTTDSIAREFSTAPLKLHLATSSRGSLTCTYHPADPSWDAPVGVTLTLTTDLSKMSASYPCCAMGAQSGHVYALALTSLSGRPMTAATQTWLKATAAGATQPR